MHLFPWVAITFLAFLFFKGNIKKLKKQVKPINTYLRRSLRQSLRQVNGLSAAIVDSQSIKTTEKKGSADTTAARKLKVGKGTYGWITGDC